MTDPTPCGDPTVQRHIGSPRPAPDQIGPDGTWAIPHSTGPCRTWPLEPGCGCLSPDAGSWDQAKTNAVEVATEILWRKTAGKYGLCQETVRPCRQKYGDQAWSNTIAGQGGTHPGLYGRIDFGRWLDIPCGCWQGRGGCGCGPVPELKLPGPVYWELPEHIGPPIPDGRPGPNSELPQHDDADLRYRLSVWIDGVQQHNNYWLIDKYTLVRTDGQPWPDYQDLTKPPVNRYDEDGNLIASAAGTWCVQYWRGLPVPPGGRRAVSILACELWKACTGATDCRLPRGIQSISREGIDYTLVDQNENMLANLPDVNGWVQEINPHNIREQPTVFSPDLPRVRSEWTNGGRGEPPPPTRRRW